MRTKKVQQKERKRSWQEREERVHDCKQKKSLGLLLMNQKRGASLMEKQEEAIKSKLMVKAKRKKDLSMLVLH